jgi:hypothetical protein
VLWRPRFSHPEKGWLRGTREQCIFSMISSSNHSFNHIKQRDIPIINADFRSTHYSLLTSSEHRAIRSLASASLTFPTELSALKDALKGTETDLVPLRELMSTKEESVPDLDEAVAASPYLPVAGRISFTESIAVKIKPLAEGRAVSARRARWSLVRTLLHHPLYRAK